VLVLASQADCDRDQDEVEDTLKVHFYHSRDDARTNYQILD